MSYNPLPQVPLKIGETAPAWARWFSALRELQSKIKVYTYDLDPGTVGANTTSESDCTLDGVRATDIVLSVNKPSHDTGLGIVNWRVKAEDTVSITFMNNTGSGISPGSETYTIVVLEQ